MLKCYSLVWGIAVTFQCHPTLLALLSKGFTGWFVVYDAVFFLFSGLSLVNCQFAHFMELLVLVFCVLKIMVYFWESCWLL